MEDDVRAEIRKLNDDIRTLRAQTITNGYQGAVTFGSLRLPADDGNFYEIRVSGGAIVLKNVGTKGI